MFLKSMSKRGFHEVLSYVDDAGSTHYNDVLRYAMEKKLVESRASVTIILNTLTRMELLERTVLDARPIRTAYSSTKKGKAILRLLGEMGREIAPRKTAGRVRDDEPVSHEQKVAKVNEMSRLLRKKEGEELEGRQRV